MASRRQYVTAAEVLAYCNTTASDEQINQAEEIIDGYIGPQQQAVPDVIYGQVSAATANTVTLEIGRHINVFQNNYFVFCEIEILDGIGAGQRQMIQSSTYAGVVTTVGNWTTTPVSPAHYRIYQLGKIPRDQDQFYDGIHSPFTYYKSIPEAIKRATAAQVQYMVTMGTNYFATDTVTLNQEKIGDYQYQRAPVSASGKELLIAPKAKVYLRGIMNRKGVFEGTIES